MSLWGCCTYMCMLHSCPNPVKMSEVGTLYIMEAGRSHPGPHHSRQFCLMCMQGRYQERERFCLALSAPGSIQFIYFIKFFLLFSRRYIYIYSAPTKKLVSHFLVTCLIFSSGQTILPVKQSLDMHYQLPRTFVWERISEHSHQKTTTRTIQDHWFNFLLCSSDYNMFSHIRTEGNVAHDW